MTAEQFILALLTLMVGLFAAWVGLQQYRGNREKFKLDLFEKRFAVYKGVRNILKRIMQTGRIEQDNLFDLLGVKQDAYFLFGDDISEFITMVEKKARKLKFIKGKFSQLLAEDERSKLIDQESELFNELSEHLADMQNVFSPYLKFEKWK